MSLIHPCLSGNNNYKVLNILRVGLRVVRQSEFPAVSLACNQFNLDDICLSSTQFFIFSQNSVNLSRLRSSAVSGIRSSKQSHECGFFINDL